METSAPPRTPTEVAPGSRRSSRREGTDVSGRVPDQRTLKTEQRAKSQCGRSPRGSLKYICTETDNTGCVQQWMHPESDVSVPVGDRVQ
jgi:hypothetical protein